MDLTTKVIKLQTKGRTDIIDITGDVQQIVSGSGFEEGAAMIFAIGSTAGITTVEYEPGLVKTDLPKFFDKLAPYNDDYAHHNTWGDDNGAAHVRASLLGCSIMVPFKQGELYLGSWQQIIFIDFDTRPRSRQVVVQLYGEKRNR